MKRDQFDGSKRKRRARQRSEAFQARLGKIAALAREIRTPQQLDAILADIEDPEVRLEVRKLLTQLTGPLDRIDPGRILAGAPGAPLLVVH